MWGLVTGLLTGASSLAAAAACFLIFCLVSACFAAADFVAACTGFFSVVFAFSCSVVSAAPSFFAATLDSSVLFR